MLNSRFPITVLVWTFVGTAGLSIMTGPKAIAKGELAKYRGGVDCDCFADENGGTVDRVCPGTFCFKKYKKCRASLGVNGGVCGDITDPNNPLSDSACDDGIWCNDLKKNEECDYCATCDVL